MPIHFVRGFLSTLWMLNFVLLGLLVVPITDGTALLVALSLWAVPTCFLLLLSWRYWHTRHGGAPVIPPGPQGKAPSQ
jgi:hypothetical protein